MLLTVPVTSHAVARVWAEGSMGKLIYAANISLDGFLEDETGSFDWSVPDEDVHAFWNEHERHIGTSLYGRRMYETMRVWESDDWLTNEHSARTGPGDAESWTCSSRTPGMRAPACVRPPCGGLPSASRSCVL